MESRDIQPLTRWYIDTRELTSTTSSLPLLETLQPNDQETIRKYYHLADRHMSLASYLLKYYFVHRTCRIPWDEIRISRTPAPHSRPCFVPSMGCSSAEFNISHQASVVALAGTVLPFISTTTTTAPYPAPILADKPILQVGIDITCVDEYSHRNKKNSAITTVQALTDFVDMFVDVFSAREQQAMKSSGFSSESIMSNSGPDTRVGAEAKAVKSAVRLFYTYWALKEAYIKMTGEALLAPWLRELEFTDVIAPEPTSATASPSSCAGSAWGVPYTGVRTWLYGKEVEDVRIEVVAFEDQYIVATAARGLGIGAESRVGDQQDPWQRLKRIDIERDITECATGSCHCLT